jgi:hypothetical protein
MSLKHWSPAKKYLEYLPEPTSLRPRNRPEIEVPRLLKDPEQGSLRLAPCGEQRRLRIAKAGSDGRRERQIQTEQSKPRRFVG